MKKLLTSEQISKTRECCKKYNTCQTCPLDDNGCSFDAEEEVMLDRIEQLEKENKSLKSTIFTDNTETLDNLLKENKELREADRWRDVNKELPEEKDKPYFIRLLNEDVNEVYYDSALFTDHPDIGENIFMVNGLPYYTDHTDGMFFRITHWKPITKPQEDK